MKKNLILKNINIIYVFLYQNLKAEEIKFDLEIDVNLCISILEFKNKKHTKRNLFINDLCISILEFKSRNSFKIQTN